MANLLLAVESGQVITFVIFGVLIVAIIVMFIFSGRRRKKQEDEAKKLMDAVKPGNKVKTIGGICGIVVEVDAAENTFVLETGTETSGKCFIKFDRQAIYQTDAVIEKDTPVKEEEPAEAPKDGEVLPLDTAEQPEEITEVKVDEKVEVTDEVKVDGKVEVMDEVKVEPVAEEKPKTSSRKKKN